MAGTYQRGVPDGFCVKPVVSLFSSIALLFQLSVLLNCSAKQLKAQGDIVQQGQVCSSVIDDRTLHRGPPPKVGLLPSPYICPLPLYSPTHPLEAPTLLVSLRWSACLVCLSLGLTPHVPVNHSSQHLLSGRFCSVCWSRGPPVSSQRAVSRPSLRLRSVPCVYAHISFTPSVLCRRSPPPGPREQCSREQTFSDLSGDTQRRGCWARGELYS